MPPLPQPIATGATRRQVPVRPYDRRVDGKFQHVGGYTQERTAAVRKEAGPVETMKLEKPEAAPAAEPPRVVIFVGGAGDSLFKPVEGYFKDFNDANPGSRTEFFSHDQPRAIRRLIEGLPAGTHISLVGHSWGGDTAAQVAARLGEDGRRITELMTIDPVGNFRGSDFYSRVLKGTGTWLNVNAIGGKWWETSNLIAGIGGPYGTSPRGVAQGFIEAPYTHGSFGSMMRGSVFRGLTLQDRLSGKSLPKATP